MQRQTTTAVLPVAGLGTRFLPLSRVFPKELWPLWNRPVLDYIITEVKNAGVKKIVLVISPEKTILKKYLKKDARIKEILAARGKEKILRELKEVEKDYRGLSFRFVLQNQPRGDGHAILQAEKIVGQAPFMVSFGDDVILGVRPCLGQLNDVFQKYGFPVLALKRTPRKKLSAYGVVRVKKLGKRLYQILDIVEKPETARAPSNLAVVGKYILTPMVMRYLKEIEPSFRHEIILANAFRKMLQDGKIIYGWEFEGDWLECGNLENWLKSNLFLAKRNNLL